MGIDRNSVFLLTGAQGDKKAFGTGFAVAHQDGQLYILTCAHVVDQLDGKVKVGRYEAEAEIEALGAADGIDLALLRIPCVQPPPLLNRPIPGEPEMKFHICGYGPFSGAKDNYVLRHIEGKLGKSIAFESVRGSGRTDAWDLHVEDDDFSRLQGGYSGSPLCDQEGRLIAVVSHKIGSQGQRGHAVAIANLKSIYPEIEQLLPSFSDTGKPVRIIRKGPLYRYLPDSTTKRLSLCLIAVAVLAGLFVYAKYQLPGRDNRGKGNTQEENALPEQSSSEVIPVHSTASKPDTATATVPSGNGSQNDIVVPRPQFGFAGCPHRASGPAHGRGYRHGGQDYPPFAGVPRHRL